MGDREVVVILRSAEHGGPDRPVGDREGVVMLVSTEIGERSKDHEDEPDMLRIWLILELSRESNEVDGGVTGRY